MLGKNVWPGLQPSRETDTVGEGDIQRNRVSSPQRSTPGAPAEQMWFTSFPTVIFLLCWPSGFEDRLSWQVQILGSCLAPWTLQGAAAVFLGTSPCAQCVPLLAPRFTA